MAEYTVQQMIDKAKELITKSNPGFTNEEKLRLACAILIGLCEALAEATHMRDVVYDNITGKIRD